LLRFRHLGVADFFAKLTLFQEEQVRRDRELREEQVRRDRELREEQVRRDERLSSLMAELRESCLFQMTLLFAVNVFFSQCGLSFCSQSEDLKWSRGQPRVLHVLVGCGA